MPQNIVIKVGGELLNHPEKTKALFKTIMQLQSKFGVVLVHGGGSLVQDWLERLGLESNKIDGIRVTPNEHLPFVVGGLAGAANTEFCGLALSQGLSPVGLTLLDGEMVKAQQVDAKFGAVGQVEPNNPRLCEQLLAEGFLPIVSTIACQADGQLLNVNADDGAVVLAKLLGAQLVLLSDVPGVLDENKSRLARLNREDLDALISNGVINQGMVAKVNAAHQAAVYLSGSVLIASWQDPELLLNLEQSDGQVGTLITP